VSLPLLQDFALLQTRWKALLDPVLKNAIWQGTLVASISLAASTPTKISTKLGRNPQGWFLVDNQANAVIWRTAWDNNTITLEASSATTISIWVF
jgi:hypothetical protein